MDAFRHLSRVTTRSAELGLFLRYLWFEIQVATGLFYLEVPEYLSLSGCDSRPLGESSIFGLHGDKELGLTSNARETSIGRAAPVSTSCTAASLRSGSSPGPQVYTTLPQIKTAPPRSSS